MSTQTAGLEPATSGWVPSPTKFAVRLAMIRAEQHWGNVVEAATACDLKVESWRSWERDGVQPRDYEKVCRKIAACTGVRLGWILGDAPDPDNDGAAKVTKRYQRLFLAAA